MNNEGWISLHRDIFTSNLWCEEPFSRGQAWVDLLLLANHKPGYIRVRGNRIDLERGDVGWSKLRLSQRWKWSRQKTACFIHELTHDGRIAIKKDNRISTVLSIINYDLYQSFGQQTVQQTVQQKDNRKTTDRTLTITNNNDNNDNKNTNTLALTKNQKEKLASDFYGINIQKELDKANDYLRAEGVQKKDYLAWFRNWLRREYEKIPHHPKPQPIEHMPEMSETQRINNLARIKEIKNRLTQKL